MLSLHQRAKDLFLAALERSPDERPAFVERACGDDTALRVEVESLLEQLGDSADLASADDSTGRPEGLATPNISAAPAAVAGERYAPGTVFAGRYRMITCLLRDAMGEVWRADDLMLEMPVALRLVPAGAERRERILRFVRVALQITHPGICRLFDVAESDGQVFLAMELVDGEFLAALLRRVGRLPSEKVVDIARQLCAGLAAAHGHGLLHLDLRTSNILIDNDGRVRIADLGITTPEMTGSVDVTSAYRAPEQLSPRGRVSEATDLYALGAILYELLTGQPPVRSSSGRGAIARPSTLAADVDAKLEKVILHALEARPADRPASAEAMLAELPQAAVASERRQLPQRWLIAGAIAALVVMAAVVWSLLTDIRPANSLTQQDTIVLADFANTTGEPVFDGALKVALAVALEQSPFLKVFPDSRVAETLRLMDRPVSGPVDRNVAREIARRERLKALLAGSIAPLGSHFVLTLEAVNAESGDVMAREQAEAATREEVLSALGQAASRLREKLGESLASIQKFDAPLVRATTSSLDALQAYSLALDRGSINPRLEAIPHLKRALELDPNFALAMALLATTYANTGQTSLAPEFAKKAFDRRDQVSERERFFISYRYYRDALQDWTQQLDLTRTWTATYPREAFAFNSLGTALIRFGRYEEALVPLREAIRLEPTFEAPYANLANALLSLGRTDEAGEVLQQARTRQARSSNFRRMSYSYALLRGDTAEMNRILEASIGAGQTNAAHGWHAHTLASGGEVRAAHDLFRRGIQMASQNGFTEVAAQLGVEDAEVHALMNQCATALNEAQSALTVSRDNFTVERASRVLAFCGEDTEAAVLLRELNARYPAATGTQRIVVPLTEAIVAFQRGDPTRTLEQLEPLRVYDRTAKVEFWTDYLRGLSHLHLKDGARAAEAFREVLTHRGEYPNSPIYSLSQLGLARALAIAGDVAGARQAYLDFLRLWKDADADLETFTAARQEYERLT